jgi:hypothetical protein
MNYGQIIGQAWSLIKRTPILWFFLFFNFLAFLILPYVQVTNTLVSVCLGMILVLLVLIFDLFYPFVIVISTEKVIQGEMPRFNDIWNDFKRQIGRLILFYLAMILPTGLLFICFSLTVGFTFNIAQFTITDYTTRITLLTFLFSLIFGALGAFSFYGLVLHHLGVLKSIKHGITVFGMNWYKCILLALLIEFPVPLVYVIIWLILFLNQPSTLPASFYQVIEMFPVSLILYAMYTIVSFFLFISMLIAYHGFIREYNYPTLKPDPSEFQTSV